ncbi:MAG: Asp-tRNA(Asn)/Glu-tRNA(Gln) amidotransferase subunit GatC [Planctomycetota bacterium]|jgi:aspartyl-tRNA(Asn)/glutamyl-tRNA(Gln) amidotransferase subunit C
MDEERVRKLAGLCRLKLAEDELRRAQEQIGGLLEHFSLLQEVDTEGVEASPYPQPIPHRMRPDRPAEVLSQQEVLANAPAQQEGQFLVPKVVES